MTMPGVAEREDRFAGLLLGTAVGDALGLPAEGLSAARARKRWGGQWRMRLVFGRGMVSDDTDHAFFVARSLLAAPGDVTAFRKNLAACLRWWFVSLPAGVGLATARACLRLWLGASPERSGVRSAGNGPAMRSALLGAFFADDEFRRRDFVAASTRLTHTDPRAETAALAVAETAALIMRGANPARDFIDRLQALADTKEWVDILRRFREAIEAGESAPEFACSLGLRHGVSGYAYHTVPVALYAWMRHPDDFRAALIAGLNCGGDTDTVGAIIGALAGCQATERGIPVDWLGAIWEWPRTTAVLRLTGRRLAQISVPNHPRPLPPVAYFRPGVLPRNLLFLLVVLSHGFRRLWPPY